MQGHPRFFAGQASSCHNYELDGYNHDANVGDCYYGNGGLGFFNGLELQSTENCPKNYVIFDQTHGTSRVMFNPAQPSKFGYAASKAEGNQTIYGRNDKCISSSSFKENSDEIDALLSLEDDDDDDDVVSTGRTPSYYNCNSPDSTCSSKVSRYRIQRCSHDQDVATAGPSNESKRARVRKMVKALRGIVPGGQQMDTPAFLDEAVKYLKYLKVEVKKIGIQSSKN